MTHFDAQAIPSLLHDLPPEQGAFVHLCRALAPGAAGTPRPPGGWDAATWDGAARLALAHGLGPLLHSRLRALGPPLSEPLREDLWRSHATAALATAQLERQLRTVAGALAERGVAAVALKGAHLAFCLPEPPPVRPLADLDLLVRREHLPRAAEALQAQGYASCDSGSLETTCGVNHCLHFARSGLLPVEVHWTIVKPTLALRVDMDEIWARAGHASVGGTRVGALAPDDLLLHLCLHACAHHLLHVPARCFLDVACVARCTHGIDWDAAAERAERWGAAKSLFWGLALARVLFDARVPAETLEALAPGGDVEEDTRLLLASLFAPPALLPSALQLGMSHPGWRARAGFLARSAGLKWRRLREGRAGVLGSTRALAAGLANLSGIGARTLVGVAARDPEQQARYATTRRLTRLLR